MSTPALTPQEVVDRFRSTFGSGIEEAVIRERTEGVKKRPSQNIWITLRQDLLKPAIQTLIDISYPHLAVISGSDVQDQIELLYTFSIYYGTKFGEYMVTLKIRIPKNDPRVPTISDLMPGAVFTEREKQEMLGIEVVGIPDSRHLFLPDDFPEGVYPWRKDEKGIPPSMIKNLWEVKRPKDRPAPPLPEKPEATACNVECADPLEANKTPVPEVKKDE
ncbi:MAG: NADH-quinone oxidoreductase subunit C [Methanomicrobiales archaeon]|nr:NADH-quinone oxidoreductase subunit C [Methanomicrobiales archaeon]